MSLLLSVATSVVALTNLTENARVLREHLIDDPIRPRYHFCIIDGKGRPADPNGAFWANGRYHLMYLYQRKSGQFWGHVSSVDLLHWRHHQDAIGLNVDGYGTVSGGAFVDEDGKAYLSYSISPVKAEGQGIAVMKSADSSYEKWIRVTERAAIPANDGWGVGKMMDPEGKEIHYGTTDPSNIWKKGGKYFLLTGSLLVLDKYGRKPDSPPDEKGDRTWLFESTDLKDWSYRGVFYQRKANETRLTGWTDEDEDNMCPSFMPLPASPTGGKMSGKWIMHFISHNRGGQYYIGTYDQDADRFIPEHHGRFTWSKPYLTAPEAVNDPSGRQILWAWATDDPFENLGSRGWSGVYCLPRALWLAPDGTLAQAPIEELKKLRFNPREWRLGSLKESESRFLDGVAGDCCEVELSLDTVSAANFSLEVLASADRTERCQISYDAQTHELVYDATQGGCKEWQVEERAPFSLKDGEELRLRVYVDRGIVEVFANDRQAISKRVWPTESASRIYLVAAKGSVRCPLARAWDIAPTNPY